jgi:hypothetical protein
MRSKVNKEGNIVIDDRYNHKRFAGSVDGRH